MQKGDWQNSPMGSPSIMERVQNELRFLANMQCIFDKTGQEGSLAQIKLLF